MTNWIPISERMPTREDADEHEQVVVKFSDDGPAVTYPYEFKNTPPDEWMYPPVAWLPLPRYTPPKPGPTDEECEELWRIVRPLPSQSYVIPNFYSRLRDWFADVTARIEREKGK